MSQVHVTSVPKHADPSHFATIATSGLDFGTILTAITTLLPVIQAAMPTVEAAIGQVYSLIASMITQLKSGGFSWTTFLAGIPAELSAAIPAIQSVVAAIAAVLKIAIPPAPTPAP